MGSPGSRPGASIEVRKPSCARSTSLPGLPSDRQLDIPTGMPNIGFEASVGVVRVIVCSGAAICLLVLAGCGSLSESSAPSPHDSPPCDGVATTDYGLGNAVQQAAVDLAALPKAFSTGVGEVSATPESDLLHVEVHLCGPDATLDDTKDAASIVAREIAEAELLGDRVATVLVVNPLAGQEITADPFDAPTFATDTAPREHRDQWALTEQER